MPTLKSSRFDFVRPDGSPLMLLYLDLEPYPSAQQEQCQQLILEHIETLSPADRYCLAVEYAKQFHWVEEPQILDMHGQPYQLSAVREGVLAHVLWSDVETRIYQAPDIDLVSILPDLRLRWQLIQELNKLRQDEPGQGNP